MEGSALLAHLRPKPSLHAAGSPHQLKCRLDGLCGKLLSCKILGRRWSKTGAHPWPVQATKILIGIMTHRTIVSHADQSLPDTRMQSPCLQTKAYSPDNDCEILESSCNYDLQRLKEPTPGQNPGVPPKSLWGGTSSNVYMLNRSSQAMGGTEGLCTCSNPDEHTSYTKHGSYCYRMMHVLKSR